MRPSTTPQAYRAAATRRWRAARAAAALLAAAVVAVISAGCGLADGHAPPAALDGPYKDVSLGTAPAHPLLTGLPAGLRLLSWAFATGECGSERWGAFDTEAFARLNVAEFNRLGLDYIVSTGGEAGIFSCASDAGMERFVARYDSPRLRGLDFDIEGAQTPAQIASLMQRIRAAQLRRPRLRMSFTLATHAASDGSGQSLNATGERVLQAIAQAGITDARLNLMVMNYGPAQSRHCVLAAGRCDMGASALQAARNVQQRYGWPLARIELTAMLGVNDVTANVFGLDDARRMRDDARRHGLGGLHFWSLDRDRPCVAGKDAVSPTCHSLPGVAPGEFTRVLLGR